MTSGNPPGELASAYLFHLAKERRLSPLTCGYARDIRALLNLAQEKPLDRLQIHHVRRFAAQLMERDFPAGV